MLAVKVAEVLRQGRTSRLGSRNLSLSKLEGAFVRRFCQVHRSLFLSKSIVCRGPMLRLGSPNLSLPSLEGAAVRRFRHVHRGLFLPKLIVRRVKVTEARSHAEVNCSRRSPRSLRPGSTLLGSPKLELVKT